MIQKYSNVAFLHPLVQSMTRPNPEDRPDAQAALQQWNAIRGEIDVFRRGWRLRHAHETNERALVLDIIWLLRLSVVLAERIVRNTFRFVTVLRQLFQSRPRGVR